MSGHANISSAPRIGVGVASFGDAAALRITMAALRRLGNVIHQVLIAEQIVGSGPRNHPQEHVGARVVQARRHDNPHAIIVDEMAASADLILLMREGLVIDAQLIDDVQRVFAERPTLSACVLRSDRVRTRAKGSQRSPDEHAGLVSMRRSRWAPRYRAPSLLCIAAHAARGSAFERYALRSDWASYRVYLDNLAALGAASAEITSDHFAAFADTPDGVVRYADGRQIYDELNRLAKAHDRYRAFVERDKRRVLLEQIAAILRGSFVRSRLSFLRGFLFEARNEARLRKRLRRDIAALG